MSDTESVQSATSNISSHSQNGIEPNYEGFKNNMIQFLKGENGLFQCNRLIHPSAWMKKFGKYSPNETYGLTLQKLVEKYKETFYFEGSGHDKKIGLVESRPSINPESKSHPVSKPSHRAINHPIPKDAFINTLFSLNKELEKMSMKDFMAIKRKLEGYDLSALKTLIAEQ